jgi:MoxR-like ATPase
MSKNAKTTRLPALGSWPEAVHVWDPNHERAVMAALAARRPLLIRGEPGTGKSQLARAAAVERNRLFVSEVVHARSESHDLLYRYDAVARLGDAQAMAGGGDRRTLAHKNYLSPGPLWWVLDWVSAQKQHARRSGQFPAPHVLAGWTPKHGAVLLIDEIDKADSDLPNGLLETLGNGAFSVPWRADPVTQQEDVPPPLVVVTTNEERELPAAFLRRCVVLNLDLPKDESEFVELLVSRGLQHFEKRCHRETCEEAAHQIWQDREKLKDSGRYRPGQAEYIDLLRVLTTEHPGDSKKQRELLEQVKAFFFDKNRPEEE